MNPFSNIKWKVMYNRGGGETYVYGDTEHDAKLNALAMYRKRDVTINYTTIDEAIKAIIRVDN